MKLKEIILSMIYGKKCPKCGHRNHSYLLDDNSHSFARSIKTYLIMEQNGIIINGVKYLLVDSGNKLGYCPDCDLYDQCGEILDTWLCCIFKDSNNKYFKKSKNK